jgi:aryl-phospho-beta-D-glucosidase BglC (GH1 family)
MRRLRGYQAGINLGLWLSQNGGKSHEHFASLITRDDIARIASWGMDHVRLPVDYFTFEDDANPGVYKEDHTVWNYIEFSHIMQTSPRQVKCAGIVHRISRRVH